MERRRLTLIVAAVLMVACASTPEQHHARYCARPDVACFPGKPNRIHVIAPKEPIKAAQASE